MQTFAHVVDALPTTGTYTAILDTDPIYRQLISKEEIAQISSLDYKASPAQVGALIGELLMLRKAVGL